MAITHAWANYNGVTDAIVDGSGISSVTRISNGFYAFNFSSPIPSGNYAVVCCSNHQTTNSRIINLTNTRSTSSVQLSIEDGTQAWGTSRANSNEVYIIVVRN